MISDRMRDVLLCMFVVTSLIGLVRQQLASKRHIQPTQRADVHTVKSAAAARDTTERFFHWKNVSHAVLHLSLSRRFFASAMQTEKLFSGRVYRNGICLCVHILVCLKVKLFEKWKRA